MTIISEETYKSVIHFEKELFKSICPCLVKSKRMKIKVIFLRIDFSL